jgi:hypothetical protein
MGYGAWTAGGIEVAERSSRPRHVSLLAAEVMPNRSNA